MSETPRQNVSTSPPKIAKVENTLTFMLYILLKIHLVQKNTLMCKDYFVFWGWEDVSSGLGQRL